MTPLADGNSNPRLLVVQPDPLDPLDRFAGWLTDAGLTVRVIQPFAGQPLPDRLQEDGLLVLGGDMSVHDDDQHPWLADIRRLFRDAVKQSRPALGICLGGQLLAQTFGGTVTVGDSRLEAGVVRVHWRSEASTDSLIAGLPTPFLTGAMHGDMIEKLPDAAVWLGHSDMYPHQAFRVGAMAWGLQFHPEISLPTYREWVSAYRGGDSVALARLKHGLQEFPQLDDKIVQATSSMARRFADLVCASAPK